MLTVWIQHLFSLFGQFVSNLFNALGTTVLGWLANVGVLAVTTCFTLLRIRREEGRGAMVKHWKEDGQVALKVGVWCSLVIYGPLIIWQFGRTVYEDHMGLVARAYQQAILIANADAERQSIRAKDQREYNDLKVSCAETVGASRQLQSQNRDQQTTINNCQTQALKLLTPEPFKIVPLVLEPASGGIEKQNVKFLLLTNRTVTPVNLVVTCRRRLLSASLSPIGAGSIMLSGPARLTDTQFQLSLDSPAWGPETPIIVSLSYFGDSNNTCSFDER